MSVIRTAVALAALAAAALGAPVAAQDDVRRFGPFVADPRYPAVLILSGEIGPGATRDFRDALLEEQVFTLVLDSPGGAILAALEIAAITADKGLETVIPANATCASACAFVFLAGRERFAEGRLGVHQFYAVEDGVELGSVTRGETQSLAATIIKYLDSFKAPSAVYIRMLGTPPDGMYWFSAEELAEEGIVTGPLTAFPEIRFEAYAPPAPPPPPAPEMPQPEAAEVLPPDPGPEPAPEPAAAPEPEPVPDPEPQAAAVSRPSFDCARAATPTEIAICTAPELGDLDTTMARLYTGLRSGAGAATRTRLRDDQRAWLRQRNACGADLGCLRAVYDRRIAELMKGG